MQAIVVGYAIFKIIPVEVSSRTGVLQAKYLVVVLIGDTAQIGNGSREAKHVGRSAAVEQACLAIHVIGIFLVVRTEFIHKSEIETCAPAKALYCFFQPVTKV